MEDAENPEESRHCFKNKKKMKKLTVLLSLVALSYVSNAQKIVKFEDDFDSRYLVDEPLIVKKDRSAIIVIPRINKEAGDDYDAIVIATNNERECVQNAELSIVFENEERIDLDSDLGLNCKGLAVFYPSNKVKELLSKYKIKAIRFKNGYNSTTVQDRINSDYFIQLHENLLNNI